MQGRLMGNDDVTMGELARRMDLLHTDVKELRHAVVEHDDLTAVASSWQMLLQAHESNSALIVKGIEGRLEKLEAWQTWALRLVAGSVGTAVLGLVAVAGPLPK